MAKSAGLVNRHYHPHEVFAYTISGKWGYLEHDWTATAGDFVYETPGEGHTLVAYESDEPMKVFFQVTGPLIWLDEAASRTGTSTCTATSPSAGPTTTRWGSGRITWRGCSADNRLRRLGFRCVECVWNPYGKRMGDFGGCVSSQ